MNTTLAIYEALIQANVPSTAARRVAEALESDMTSHLATKQDLLQLEQRIDARFVGVEGRFAAIDARFVAIDTRFDAVDARFDALEQRFDLKLQNLETRLVVKLGALMVVLFGVLGTALTLVR